MPKLPNYDPAQHMIRPEDLCMTRREMLHRAGMGMGALGLMMLLGGSVHGGLHGTAASLAPGNPTLENSSGDVHYETDFRSVYARVIDQWLGADSRAILGNDFRAPALTFI